MEPPTAHRSALIAIWSTPFVLGGLALGFVLAGLFPPPTPDLTAAEATAQLYDDVTVLRIGLVVTCLAASGFIPWAAAVASQMRRIEGPGAPMARVMVTAASLVAGLTWMIMFFLLAIVFREGTPDELVLYVYDVFWLLAVGLTMPTTVMGLALTVTVLGDRSASPLLPRWLGWLSAWYTLSSFGGILVPFFQTGPFAWNGAIAYYTAFTAFFVWFILASIEVRKAILVQLREAGAT